MLPRISTDRNQNVQPHNDDIRKETRAEEDQKSLQPMGNEAMAEKLFEIVTKPVLSGGIGEQDDDPGAEKGMTEKEQPDPVDFFGNKIDNNSDNDLLLNHSVTEYAPNGNIIGSKKVNKKRANADAEKLLGAAVDK